MRPHVVALAASLGFIAGMFLRVAMRRGRPRGRVRMAEPRIDDALEATFPASDPPATTGSLVSGSPGRR